MTVALLAPGQGGQRPGMLAAQLRDPAAAELLQSLVADVDASLEDLDSEEVQRSSSGAQLATALCSLGAAATLAAQGVRADLLAGHSVGALTAAVLAGALDAETALRVIAVRGRAMDRIGGDWGMLALEGIDAMRAIGLAAEASSDEAPVWMACDNAPGQVVLGGAGDALRRAGALAAQAGARRAVALRVPAPSHGPLLSSVADAVAEALDDVEVTRPRVPLALASSGRLARSADDVRADLIAGVRLPVRWRQTVASLVERGADRLVVLPPGPLPVVAPERASALVLAVDELGSAVVARRAV